LQADPRPYLAAEVIGIEFRKAKGRLAPPSSLGTRLMRMVQSAPVCPRGEIAAGSL